MLWISSPHAPWNNGLLTLRQFQTFSQTPSWLAVVHLSPSGCVHAANPSPLPGIWTQKSEPQLPAPTHPGGWADRPLRLVSAGRHCSSVWECLCFSLCTSFAALSSMAPKLLPPTPYLHQWRGFLVCGNISSFTAPSQRCRSHPYSFVSVFSFFFCPPQMLRPDTRPEHQDPVSHTAWYVGIFLPFGKCEVFCQHSVGVL